MLTPLIGSLLRPRSVGVHVPGETTEATLEMLRHRRETDAADAWNRGQAAFAAGALDQAGRWLDRARRIAPADQTVALVLAMVRLRQGSGEAPALFEAVLRHHDLRTAWLGLAQARRLTGDHDGAAAALGEGLARHAAPVDAALAQLATGIAAAAGAPGWCALGSDLHLTVSTRPVRLLLDGRVKRLPPGGRLPPAWLRAGRLEVLSGDVPLLGSALALGRILRVEGCVEGRDGGLIGWAWHPDDPGQDPVLRIVPARGRPLLLTARDSDDTLHGQMPLAQPRRFALSAQELASFRGAVRVVGRDGRELLGSPLDPLAERRSAAALTGSVALRYPARRRSGRSTESSTGAVVPFAPVAADVVGDRPLSRQAARGIAVVVPVYGGLAQTRACVEQVLATVPDTVTIVVVDDASPEPQMAELLENLARGGRIRVLRHAGNRGFPAAANTGMRACGGADVVLLNSDTLVSPGWLARLAAAAHSAADIGTATPLSNDASILSYPAITGGNQVPDAAETGRLAALAHRANAGRVVEIPTAVGFCMFIRRDCLDQVGLLREDVFAQGYGEENDFCLRARHLGWRHVAAVGVFVAHVGGQSFGAARSHLLARNLALLNRLHPGYDALIAAHRADDPLATARRRMDLVRWHQHISQRKAPSGTVLLITHAMGGGVERQVAARIAALTAQGFRAVVLRPELLRPGLCRIADGGKSGAAFPNLYYRVPEELPALGRVLAAMRPSHFELHHLVGHCHGVLELCRALGLPYEVHVHDYAWFCPRISLIGPERRYCGEPAAVHCESCIADAGRNIEEEITVADLRRRSAEDFSRARRVVVPSADAAIRIARHFPGTAAEIVPWDEVRPAGFSRDAARPAKIRVCVIGAIGTEKGYDMLLACARDAALRGLPLEFVVIGYTVDDRRLLETGTVFVTGEYQAAELPDLIACQAADLAWLPSIWPETWCFTLSEAWRAGLDVVAFDIGAQAERIRAHGGGLLLPLGLPPASLNNTFLASRLAVRNGEEAASGVSGRQADGSWPTPSSSRILLPQRRATS